MQKTIVITGANGFIGRHLTKKAIDLGYVVYAVVTDKEGLADLSSASLHVIEATYDDFCKLPDCLPEGIEYFVHLAWQGHWQKQLQGSYELQLLNAVYAGKAFENAQSLKAEKFVYVTTVNVFEVTSLLEKGDYSSSLRPGVLYALGKVAGEIICGYLSSSGVTSFNSVCLPMAYGPGNKSLMVPNVCISKLMQGIPVDLVKGNGQYDLVYIDDIVEGLVAVLERGQRNKSYYLGHQDIKTFKEIFHSIGQILDPTVKMRFGAYPGDNSIDFSHIDLNALAVDTGFVCHADFAKSIFKTAEWLKANDYLGIK